jgi:signal recognition particle receptor subunit alpha
MDSIVVNKDDEDAHKVNIEAEMEKYLGGDDEVLKGFYDSDEDVQFDSIGTSKAAASTQSLFGRLTGAF